MLFTAKKDAVYSVLVWLTVLVSLWMIVTEFSWSFSGIIWLVTGTLILGLLLWFWFGTNYRITEGTLIIHNGPFRYRITVNEIHRIRKTKSILATPALSVDRLAVEYGKYMDVQISPQNEEEFVELLVRLNPDIQVDAGESR